MMTLKVMLYVTAMLVVFLEHLTGFPAKTFSFDDDDDPGLLLFLFTSFT